MYFTVATLVVCISWSISKQIKTNSFRNMTARETRATPIDLPHSDGHFATITFSYVPSVLVFFVKALAVNR